MASESGTMDYWRKFFRSAKSDVIDVIEYAILVASSDCPKELRSRRDQITEKLYASWVPRCTGCDRDEIRSDGREDEHGSFDFERRGGGKNSKTGSSSEGIEVLTPVVSDFSYNEVEALTDEIEEANQVLGEVLRIKEVLSNNQDESDNVLFESLRRLQLMALSVETLKVTDIGRVVNGLRRHTSKQIRHLVRTLVEEWKVLVDEWISATTVIANDEDNFPDSVSPDDEDQQEGLPSPPLDEGALWTTQPSSIQFSEFFDGMDDEGNIRTNVDIDDRKGPSEKLEEIVRKTQIPEDDGQMRRQETVVRETKPRGTGKEERRQEPVFRERNSLDYQNGRTMPQPIGNKENKQTLTTKQSSDMRISSVLNPAGVQKKPLPASCNSISQRKHSMVDSGPGRPSKLPTEKKVIGEFNAVIHRMPSNALQDQSKTSDDVSLRAKLEAAKRKLHENYQQAENAKKQRTIQVMELQDIPKNSHISRQPIPKHKNNIRNLLKGRR